MDEEDIELEEDELDVECVESEDDESDMRDKCVLRYFSVDEIVMIATYIKFGLRERVWVISCPNSPTLFHEDP